jgi:hypothetical protein
MPLTQHELELRKAALERIERGLLPRKIPKTIWAGGGSGRPCSLCDQAIRRTEMEYELPEPDGAAGERTVRLHLRCHAVWQLELADLSRRQGGDPAGLPAGGVR